MEAANFLRLFLVSGNTKRQSQLTFGTLHLRKEVKRMLNLFVWVKSISREE